MTALPTAERKRAQLCARPCVRLHLAPRHRGLLYGAIVTGCFYGFSMYSRALKKQFGLSQSQLDNINTVPYAFGLLSPLFGKLSILLGPRLSILLGGLWCAAWQLVLFLLATKRLVLPSVAPSLSLVVASIFVYNGVQLVSAAVFSTPVVHFPRQRGQAASLVKSFVGLGATVVAQLYVLGFGVPTTVPRRSTACCSGRARR